MFSRKPREESNLHIAWNYDGASEVFAVEGTNVTEVAAAREALKALSGIPIKTLGFGKGDK